MKRKITALLALLMALSLSLFGCGKQEETGLEGIYRGQSMSYSGLAIDVDSDSNYIELKSGGKGTICVEGTKESVKWSADGSNLNIRVEGEDCPASISDGVLQVSLMGIDYTYIGENGAGAGVSGSAAASALSGSVLDRLKAVNDGDAPYSQVSSDTGSAGDYDYGFGNDDSSGDWDVSAGYTESSSGLASELAIEKGLDDSWFGEGEADPQALAEFYYWWVDELSWSEKEELYADFYDMLVEKAGCKPADDNDDEYMERAQFKYNSGEFIFYLTKNGDVWEWGDCSVTGEVMEIYRELRGN